MIHAAREPGAGGLAPFAIAVSLAVFAAMQVAALSRVGWMFEYPLDDPYIHLAMAEQIARGGYGINPGEYASAASSALYPLLLAPIAEWRLAPMLWNVVGLVASAWLFARILIESGFAARFPRAVWLAALAPVALNLPGLAFTGMEHTLHAAAALAVVLGLLRVAQGEIVGPMLIAGVFLSSALRLEGLALGLLAAGAVFLMRGIVHGIGLAATALVPVAALVAFLTAHGIGPLPSSVMTKTGAGADLSLIDRLQVTFAGNLGSIPGLGLLLLTALTLIAAALSGNRNMRLVGLAAGGAGLAHLLFGQIGWMNRYEVYITLTLAATLLALSAQPRAHPVLTAIPAVPVLLAMALIYALDFIVIGSWGPRAIHLQQAQMARFVRDYYPARIAVNDIGWVSWGNPNHVLDLWGLGSGEAREARFEGKPGWIADLVRADGAELAMIYDQHLPGPHQGWTRVGYLTLDITRGYLGGGTVAFYATRPEAVAPLRAALDAYAPTLPEGVRFFPAPEVGS